MEEHLITEESKLSQEMSNMHEQLEKNKGVALKASSKEKKSSSSTSKTMVEEDSDEDSDLNMTSELMALFVKKSTNIREEWLPQQEQRQRQDQDKEDFQEAMLWVWQGGSLHCRVS
jgi:hypothetical protein